MADRDPPETGGAAGALLQRIDRRVYKVLKTQERILIKGIDQIAEYLLEQRSVTAARHIPVQRQPQIRRDAVKAQIRMDHGRFVLAAYLVKALVGIDRARLFCRQPLFGSAVDREEPVYMGGFLGAKAAGITIPDVREDQEIIPCAAEFTVVSAPAGIP